MKTWTYEGEQCGQIIERSREIENWFQLGSTVINLIPKKKQVRLADHLSVNEPVRMGEILAYKINRIYFLHK